MAHYMRFKTVLGATLTVGTLALWGCGGSGSSGHHASTGVAVTGTAATGQAIGGAEVVASCADERGFSSVVTTDNNGLFSGKVGTNALPCALKVSQAGATFYGWVAASGTANITPLTTAILGTTLAAGEGLEAWFANAQAIQQVGDEINGATSQWVTGLVNKGYLLAADQSTFDPFTSAFMAADADGKDGDSIDRVLDALGESLNGEPLTDVESIPAAPDYFTAEPLPEEGSTDNGDSDADGGNSIIQNMKLDERFKADCGVAVDEYSYAPCDVNKDKFAQAVSVVFPSINVDRYSFSADEWGGVPGQLALEGVGNGKLRVTLTVDGEPEPFAREGAFSVSRNEDTFPDEVEYQISLCVDADQCDGIEADADWEIYLSDNLGLGLEFTLMSSNDDIVYADGDNDINFSGVGAINQLAKFDGLWTGITYPACEGVSDSSPMTLNIDSASKKVTVDFGCDGLDIDRQTVFDVSDLMAFLAGGGDTLIGFGVDREDGFESFMKPDATLIYDFELNDGNGTSHFDDNHCGFVRVAEGELREPDCR